MQRGTARTSDERVVTPAFGWVHVLLFPIGAAALGLTLMALGLGAMENGGGGPVAVVGAVFVVLSGPAAAFGVRGVAQLRALQDANAATLGAGPGPVVHVVPYWDEGGHPSTLAEIYRLGEEVPLGSVYLGPLDRRFDPTVAFHAWGPLVEGQPISLTSVDHAQLVLPRRALAAAPPPGPAPRATREAAMVIGWPSRGHPGDRNRTALVDATLDEVRRRGRLAGAAAALTVLLLAIALGLLLPGGSAAGTIVGVLLVGSGTVMLIARHARDLLGSPLRQLVAPVTTDAELARAVARRVHTARKRL